MSEPFNSMPLRSLALAVATALAGCSSSSDSDPDNEESSDPTSEVSSGPTSEVLSDPTSAFALCHDANADGQCADTEGAQRFSSLADAMAASVSPGQGPVIVSGEDRTLFTAASSASTADAWTTLTYNEALFNPLLGPAGVSAAAYLADKLGVAEGALTDEQSSALRNSVIAARGQFPDANPYQVIAAVIDAAVAQGSLDNAMPTAEQVASPYVLSQVYSVAPEPQVVATWEPSDHDERVRLIVPEGDHIMVINRWHNGIGWVDSAATDATVDIQPFATMATAGHHEYTTEADYVTGASEHTITQSWLNDNADVLYALVAGPREVDSPEDDSYGLFRVPLVDGKLPEHSVAAIDGSTTHNVPHRHPSVARVDSKTLEQALQLADGTVLAYDSEAAYVRVYDEALQEDTSRAFPLDRPLLGWSVANNGASVLLLLGEKDGASTAELAMHSAADLSESGRVSVPLEASLLLAHETASRALVVADNNVHIIDVPSASLADSTSLISAPASTSALNSDGTRAALVYGGAINILNLTEAFPFIEGKVPYSGRLRALTFNGTEEIVYASSAGELQRASIQGLTSTPMGVNDVLTAALDAVSEDSINHGYPLDAVIYPMALPTTYGPADYLWSSSDAAVNVAGGETQGAITQGDADAAVELGVSAQYNFRGDVTTSDAKAFSVTVRAASATVDPIVTPLSGTHAKHEFSRLAASADGQLLAGYTGGIEGVGAGIVVFARQADNTVAYLHGGDGAIALPPGFEDARVDLLTFAGDSVRVVVREAQARGAEEGDGVGRVLTLDPATATWNTEATLTLPGKGNKAALSQDGNVLAIWVEEPAGETPDVKVHTFANDDLAPIATIDIDGNPRYWAFAVDNSGRHIMAYYNYRGDEGTLRNTRLYVAGGDEAAAVDVITRPTYGYFYDNASDTLVTANFDAALRIYPGVTTNDLAVFSDFATARGRYYPGKSGGHGAGRMYYGGIVDTTAYVWSGQRGLVAVDVSNPASPRELFFSPLDYAVTGVLSADGAVAFSHAFDDDTRSGHIAVVPLTDN